MFYDGFMMVLDVIIAGPFLLDSAYRRRMAVALPGWTAPKAMFFLVATMSLVVICGHWLNYNAS